MNQRSLVHLAALAGIGVDFFMPLLFSVWFPLAIWQLGKKSEENDWHGREAVRFQVVMTIYAASCFALMFVGILSTTGTILMVEDVHLGQLFALSGWFIVPMIGMVSVAVLTIVLPIVAAIRAHDGTRYVYPLVFSPRRRARWVPAD